MTAVYLEVGTKRVFACALDWPGWCRSGRDDEAALDALATYLPRYAQVATRAGQTLPLDAGDAFRIVERLPGTSAYTDFGAPGEIATADTVPLDVDGAQRFAGLLRAAWDTLDQAVGESSAELRKGPRGGGRDRDPMAEHVLGAEAAYARKIGVRHRQPALADAPAIEAMRTGILSAITGSTDTPNGWPIRYAVRRMAWHVLDHAWEMQDKTLPVR